MVVYIEFFKNLFLNKWDPMGIEMQLSSNLLDFKKKWQIWYVQLQTPFKL